MHVQTSADIVVLLMPAITGMHIGPSHAHRDPTFAKRYQCFHKSFALSNQRVQCHQHLPREGLLSRGLETDKLRTLHLALALTRQLQILNQYPGATSCRADSIRHGMVRGCVKRGKTTCWHRDEKFLTCFVDHHRLIIGPSASWRWHFIRFSPDKGHSSRVF